MEIRILSSNKEEGKVSFIIKDTTPAFANTLRRIIVDEVPTMAVEEVEFRKNNSISYDEMIAHRIGLIPLTTDLKSYNLPEKCKCDGEGCARCQLKLTLKATKGSGVVYASELKSKDPKVKPVYPKMPIVKLLKGQSLELEATAVLGKGKDHAKWQPSSVSVLKPEDNNEYKFELLIESVGALPAAEILSHSLQILRKKIDMIHDNLEEANKVEKEKTKSAS